MQHSNSTPQNLPKIKVNLCSYKDMYLNVLSTIIHYSSSLEMTQVFINWWQMDKQNVAWPCNGILYSNIMEWTSDTLRTIDEWRNHDAT